MAIATQLDLEDLGRAEGLAMALRGGVATGRRGTSGIDCNPDRHFSSTRRSSSLRTSSYLIYGSATTLVRAAGRNYFGEVGNAS